MGKAQTWLVLLLGMLSLHAQNFAPGAFRVINPAAAGPARREFLSDSGKYRVSLEDWATNSVTSGRMALWANVVRLDGDPPTFLWSAPVLGRTSISLADKDVVVSDDGEFFLLSLNGGEWSLIREDQPAARVLDSFMRRQPNRPGYHDSIVELDRFEGEPIIRVWQTSSETWQAQRLSSDKPIKPTPEMITKWNESARQKIIKGINRLKNDQLRRKLEEVSPKLSRMTQSALPPAKADEVREVHYEFLSMLRDPRDRVLFEELIARPIIGPAPPGWPANIPWNGYANLTFMAGGTGIAWTPNTIFRSADATRMRGDRLLGIFDKKPEAMKLERLVPPSPQPLFYLGRVEGAVELPTPVVKNAGKLRIYLAREKTAGKDWSEDTIEKLEGSLAGSAANVLDWNDEIPFGFATVSTGKYLIKAIWDKRRGFEDIQKAGPGDYESAWIGPLEVTAGSNLKIVIPCTNQISGGEAYYQADQLAARLWRKRGEEIISNSIPRFPKRKELFNPSTESWIVQTNVAPRQRQHGITRITLVEPPAPHNPNSLPRPPQIIVVARKSRFAEGPPVVRTEYLRILDDHGCSFAPSETGHTAQTVSYVFTAFPRGSKTFRLVAYGDGKKSEILFDYTVANPFPTQPTAIVAQTLPLQLKVKNIEMTVNRVSGAAINGWMETSFTEDGKPTDDWWASEIIFGDADGNILDPDYMCREQKATRVLGRISRVKGDETMPFEFAINRLKAWTEKNP